MQDSCCALLTLQRHPAGRAQQHKRQRIPHAAQDDLRGDYFQADPNRDKAPIRRNGIEEPDEATRRDQPQAQQDAQARAEAQAPRGAQAQMRGQAGSGDTPHATSGAGQPSAQAQEGAQAQQGGGNGDQYRIPGDGLQLTPQEEYDAVVGEDYALSGRRFMSDADAISIIGMGTWRLRSFVSPAIYTLAAWLEGTWRHSLELDLGRAHVDHVRQAPSLSLSDRGPTPFSPSPTHVHALAGLLF